MKLKLQFISIFCLVLFNSNGSDFYSKLKFYHLTNSHGLSQNTINCIHQDNTGYIWIGTNGGLSKWNGYTFNNYIHSKTDTTTIGQGRINSIYEDHEGNLWIGTFQGGLSLYDSKNDRFIRYSNNADPLNLNNGNNITQIVEFGNLMLIGTFGSGLFIFNHEFQSFTHVPISTNKNEKITELSIQKLFVENDSVLWLAHSDGLIKINSIKLNNNNFTAFGEIILENQSILTAYKTIDNKVIFGSHSKGILQFDSVSKKVKYNKHRYSIKELSSYTIRDFIEDAYGNLWIASESNGVYLYNRTKKTLTNYSSLQNNPTTLTSNIIYCFAKDKNKNIWVGTFNGGVNYVNYTKQRFNHIRGYGEANELNNNAVLSFCELTDSSFLIGTDGGGLSIYNTNKQKITAFNEIPELSAKGVVVCIDKDTKGNIYIGTYKNGLYVYNTFNKAFTNHKKGSSSTNLLSNDIWAIEAVNNTEVWIGTLGSGISKYNPTTGQFRNFFHSPEDTNSLSNNFISKICATSNGQLWIATHQAGINILKDETKGIFTHISSNKNTGLTSNEIWDIYEDSNNDIWIATHDGGLCKLNKATNKFTAFTTENGLPSNNIRAVVEDKNNWLWLSTNKGLSKTPLNNKAASFTNFTIQHGLQGNEFNANASLSTSSNFLVFGGNNGFNIFHPDKIEFKSLDASLVITQINAQYHNMESKSNIKSLQNIRPNNKILVLNHGILILNIEYALLDYTFTETNQYQYKLEGYHKDWIDNNNSRKISFTNLDPGEYLLKIKGADSFGNQLGKEAKIQINILPPYWQKAWFKLLVTIFLSSIIWLAFFIRIKSFKKQQKKLEERVDERTKELVELNKLLSSKNHEIESQSEELKSQREQLIETNTSLENSNKHIEIQNTELEKHRNNLESLVKERTQQLENAKLKAEESEKLKMSFLANMSHEIRTPLNAIVGFSSLITDEFYDTTERNSFANLINQNCNSLLLLIDDILDLSKIEANQLTINKTNFDIIAVLEEVYTHWSVIKKHTPPSITFTFDKPDPKPLQIFSDQNRIKQIVNNLIDNAFKFTSKGLITLSLKLEQKELFIEVSDTGIGIPPNEIQSIFDRFRKNENNHEKAYRGAGLGLTISKKLANLLCGNLHVTSEMNKGSKFTLVIPI